MATPTEPTYQQYPVPPSLRDHVAFFYAMNTDSANYPTSGEMLMPSATPIFGMQYQGNWEVRFGNTAFVLPLGYVCGQQLNSYRLLPLEQKCAIVGAALHPTLLWRLYKLNMQEMNNRVQPADLILTAGYTAFQQAFSACEDNEQRVAVLSNFMEDLVSLNNPELTLVDSIIGEIFKSRGCVSIKELAGRFNVSERFLQQQFRKQLGVSPASYSRMIRFNHIFSEYALKDADKNLSVLTALYNYYDAAHFNKDFRKYAGHAPSAFDIQQFQLLLDLVRNGPYLTSVAGTP